MSTPHVLSIHLTPYALRRLFGRLNQDKFHDSSRILFLEVWPFKSVRLDLGTPK